MSPDPDLTSGPNAPERRHESDRLGTDRDRPPLVLPCAVWPSQKPGNSSWMQCTLAQALTQTDDMVLLTSAAGIIQFVNPAFERLTSDLFEEITNINCRYLQNDDREQPELKVVRDAIANGEYCLVVVRNYRKDRSMFWNELSISPIYDKDGSVSNFIGIQKDVTSRILIQDSLREENKSLEQMRLGLEQLAIRDGLTGVYNRRFFDVQLDIQWRIARRNAELITLMMIDVDHFKNFNDIYGHQAGDVALKSVATCLDQAFLRSSDFLARYGGEEFVILSAGMSLKQATTFTEGLCERVRNLEIPHSASSTGYLTVSVGFSVRAVGANDKADVLLQEADRALYAAKKNGRNQSIGH